jgi:O-antigen ligase
MASSPPFSSRARGGNRAVQSFRGDDGRVAPKLHPLEKALLTVAGAQLVFMPWALGSMHVWSQLTALGLAALAFLLALWPRHYTEEYAREGAFKLLMWPKLTRFPGCWLGLLLLAYLATQALNPAWAHTPFLGQSWTLLPQEHIAWLPSGIDAPFASMNAWRMLIIYGAVWLLACALWVGLTRRQAVHGLLYVIAGNGALLAVLAIVQRLTGTRDILWFIQGKPEYFVGTIIYKNHAGAYFNLVVATAAALALWHLMRAARRMQRDSPAPVFLFCALLAGVTVIISYSRMATFLLMAFALVGLAIFLGWQAWGRTAGTRNPLVALLLAAVFLAFIGLGGYVLRFDRAAERVDHIIQEIRGERDGVSVSHRRIATQATWEMAADRRLWGWGAGGFRWMFPAYQQNHPEILTPSWNKRVRFFWEYAHNDYAQLTAELGWVGVGLLLLLLLSMVTLLVARGAFTRLPLLLLLAGLGGTLVHSWVDFGLYNPAILTSWVALGILVIRWAETDRRH